MRIAIVHYHLGPGGVAEVIRASIPKPSSRAGNDPLRHVILTGVAPPDAGNLPLRAVEGLGYGNDNSPAAAEALLDRMRRAAGESLGAEPDIWHFHNHSLGKNPALTRAAAILAARGARVILHIHDLAEDGRPALHRTLRPVAERFPVTPRVRYLFINPRDHDIFLRAGLPAANALVLTNPIAATARPDSPAPSRAPLFLAPIRGLRRKNLGELVLLSVLSPVSARFAVTLAPDNPADLPVHDRWKRFAREYARRIEFEVTGRIAPAEGRPASFESWLSHATHIAGTSVAEGFGLPFLEAAAWRKPFVGRRLAHLGHDLPRARLYDRLLVPSDWIARPLLTDQLRLALERNHRAWLKPLPQSHIDATLDHLWGGAWLDFGNLPETIQQAVIERCADATERRAPMIESDGKREPAAGWLARVAAEPADNHEFQLPESCRPDHYRNRLLSIYRDLTEKPAAEARFISPGDILAPFLRPEAFHFLLSAPRPQRPRPDRFRAIIFDVYGTLLVAPPGAVHADPSVDPALRRIIGRFGHTPPDSPTTALAEAVARHHQSADTPHPEADLRGLWRILLDLPSGHDTTALVIATEDARLPTRPMPGAAEVIRRLAAAGVPLGLLSNAQCGTLRSLGDIAGLIDPDLAILSYRFGVAKPSPVLFSALTERLARLGIAPGDCLLIGNDPLQDIAPAAAAGFQTALFTGHPDSLRPGVADPDFILRDWPSLWPLASAEMRND